VRPVPRERAHEAAPPFSPGAAESLVSFIRLLDGSVLQPTAGRTHVREGPRWLMPSGVSPDSASSTRSRSELPDEAADQPCQPQRDERYPADKEPELEGTLGGPETEEPQKNLCLSYATEPMASQKTINTIPDANRIAASPICGLIVSPDYLVAPPSRVRPTLELSCEAPIVPGFVSFNSLFDSTVFRPWRSAGTASPANRTLPLGKTSRNVVEHKLASVDKQVASLA
jgi:hypothetical protein